MEAAIVSGYKLLRELGARPLPSFAALDAKPRRPEEALCVVERFARDTGAGAEAAAVFLRDAKRLTQIKHPNLVRVRDVVLGPSMVLLVSDWIDGELLSDVLRIAAEQGVPIPLAGSLRVVVDLLEGLSALHEVCDAKREPLQIVHAEVAPRNIVVGIDGQAVLVHPLRAPTNVDDDHAGHAGHAKDAVGYLAPEVLLGDQTADQRADVYGAGVLLWEALAGRSMHPEGEDAGEIVMRLLGGKIAALATPPDAPWAAPLVDVAKRAVSPDPSVRFANATAMLAEVRRVAGARLAPKLTVSALVEAVAGERIRARAEGFGATRTRARLPSESAWTTEAETAAATPRVPAAEIIDPEATGRPPPVRAAAPSRPFPASAKAPPPPAARPAPALAFEPDSLSIDIEETEIESAEPRPVEPPRLPAVAAPLPSAPVLPSPSAPELRREMTESKTDMAASVAAMAPSVTSKARWSIVVACALCFAAVLWMLLRPSAETRPDSTDPPVPSAAGSAPLPSPVPSPSAAAVAGEPGNAPPTLPAQGADPGAAEPSADVRRGPRAAPPAAPPIPTVSPPLGAAATSQAAPAAVAPPASSTHPKKRVYDPMGI